jgi:hypothetical protein
MKFKAVIENKEEGIRRVEFHSLDKSLPVLTEIVRDKYLHPGETLVYIVEIREEEQR